MRKPLLGIVVWLSLLASGLAACGPDGSGTPDAAVADAGPADGTVTSPDGQVDAGADAGPGTTVFTKGAADRFLLRGMVLTPAGPMAGEVLVSGNRIVCVMPTCSSYPEAAGATVVQTSGVIMPGMIDTHNHALFNIFDEGDWSPQRLYMNHNQWTSPSNEPRYPQMVDAKQYLESTAGGLACELDKYAEVKALIAGETSILVAATARKCFGSLARTIDTQYNDLGIDTIRTNAISIPDNTDAMALCADEAAGDNYVIHIAEGIDGTSKNEFTTLAGRASGCLLNPRTVIVHGTALGTPEFMQMAAANMKLVWSPKSNLFLYGDTTRIDLAIAAGVQTIALAPDWSLGGSVNLLDELRVADMVDRTKFNRVIGQRRLIDMVTIDAAKAVGMEAYIGSLEVDKRADVTIIDGNAADPYAAVIAARPASVVMTMVNGQVVYGDAALVTAGPVGPACETMTVCGAQKFLCAAEAATTDKLNQSFADIVQALTTGLASYDTMVAPMGIAPFSPLAPITHCP